MEGLHQAIKQGSTRHMCTAGGQCMKSRAWFRGISIQMEIQNQAICDIDPPGKAKWRNLQLEAEDDIED